MNNSYEKKLSWKEAFAIAAAPPPARLTVTVDGRTIHVDRAAYVAAKTKQLRDFGYGDLTEQHVSEQAQAVLDGKDIGSGLTVIGGFIKEEVKMENQSAIRNPQS